MIFTIHLIQLCNNIKNCNKMFSEAGRSYDKTRVVSPYRTKQRFRYYQLPPVQVSKPQPKLYQTLDTNLREKRDSYLLRYAKDITINTDHSPTYDFVKPISPRHSMPKAPLIRFIGDIRDQDYTKPLMENCDHRCAKANNIPIQKTQDEGQPIQENMRENLPLLCMQSDKNSSLTTIQPLNLSKKLGMSDLKSTQHSLIKKRSKITLQSHKEYAKQEHKRGVSFDSSIGHQYLREVDNRQRYPQVYDIQKSKESLIRRSMNQPNIHVKFGQFRNSIATRYDRSDPYWHLSMDQSNCQIPQKDMSYDFNLHSQRKINEVKSKYPFRQCMNFYIFPNKQVKLLG